MSASFTKNFMLCTNESEATAHAFLSHTDGVLENALLLYYETNGQNSKLVLPPPSRSPSPPNNCSFATFATVSHSQNSTTVRISTPPTQPATMMPASPPARPFSSPRQTFSSIPPIRLPPPHSLRFFENKTLSPTMSTNELNEHIIDTLRQDCQELENRNQCTLMDLYEANDIVSVQLDMIETLRYKLKMATKKNTMLVKKNVVSW